MIRDKARRQYRFLTIGLPDVLHRHPDAGSSVRSLVPRHGLARYPDTDGDKFGHDGGRMITCRHEAGTIATVIPTPMGASPTGVRISGRMEKYLAVRSLSYRHGSACPYSYQDKATAGEGFSSYRHGPAYPGQLSRHVRVVTARTSRTMTMGERARAAKSFSDRHFILIRMGTHSAMAVRQRARRQFLLRPPPYSDSYGAQTRRLALVAASFQVQGDRAGALYGEMIRSLLQRIALQTTGSRQIRSTGTGRSVAVPSTCRQPGHLT
jgi:hypothetical protein